MASADMHVKIELDAGNARELKLNRRSETILKAISSGKPDKEAAKKDVELLIKQADAVKSHTSDGKPATGEVRQIVEQVAKLQTFIGAHPIPTMTNWQSVQTSLGKLQQAFGLEQPQDEQGEVVTAATAAVTSGWRCRST